MAVEFRDYYVILGVSRSADEEEIRRAFRKLARLYHPDMTGNDRRAEDRFKEINEAYEVLGDSERRKKYDEFTLMWPNGNDWQFPPAWEDPDSKAKTGRSDHFTFTGTGFSDFFEQLFGQNANPKPPGSKSPGAEFYQDTANEGNDLETDLYVSLEEVARGSTRPVTLRRAVRCMRCYGMGQYNAHSCESCHGQGNIVQTSSFQVKVPPGIPEGACLRVGGQGEKGLVGEAGDLYLKVRYTKHPEFKVDNGQLVYELEIPAWQAALGATASVPTFSGRVNIKIPAGAQPGQKLRLKGRGLPQLKGGAGDFFVQIKVQVPSATDSRQKQLWEELARETASAGQHA
jgi:curved DNA-binding protein